MKSSSYIGYIGFVLMCIAALGIVTIWPPGHSKKTPAKDLAGKFETVMRESYEQGFNQALDSIAMLNLELSLKDERKTFGEMNEILRERHKISPP